MVKKVLIVTVHIGANFGSALQAYATQKIFEELGCNAEILDYRPPRTTYKYYFRNIIRSFKDFAITLLYFPNIIINNYIFGCFLRKNCKLTKPYYEIDILRKDMPEADIYVTGSDQVWNSVYNQGIDLIYYWDFLPKIKHKIAFSSSFGSDLIPSDEMIQIKNLLSTYKFISVREKSAQLLLKKTGFDQIEHLLDPTLILNKKKWSELVKNRIINEPYLLVYVPYNIVSKDIIYATARKIAAQKGLKIVTFSWSYVKNIYADRTIYYASPIDFLTLYFYADYIITNSFHGTAFSINLHKKFWVYDPTGFSTRITSLLELTELGDRRLVDIISDHLIDSQIDFETVENILSKERMKVFDFLKYALI